MTTMADPSPPMAVDLDDSLPSEPPDFEYAGVFDGDMRFLSCTRCGALVAADASNITRHNEMHRQASQPQTVVQNITAPPPEDNSLSGDDLAELLRDTVKAEMRSLGITQVRLSEMAGVSQKHLSQMFTGNAVGSLELWSKIALVMKRKWAVSLAETDE